MRALLALCCLLSLSSVASAQSPPAVSLAELREGQTVVIRTADRVYRTQLVDRSTGETRTQVSWDGFSFSRPRTVFLLGATSGPNADGGELMLVRMHEIKPGLRLELGIDGLEESQRRLTTPVQSIRTL